jgi:two-component system, chemotaxis family, sensor histidine kinase and response regulator PixL
MDREQEIQFQFLDEAQEYIRTLETMLIGLGNGIDGDRVNAALRAAHSIKGGAGMMGFPLLSELAHRLEDSLKVLKIQKNTITVDSALENLMLTAVERLDQVAELDRQNRPADPNWLDQQVQPLFTELHSRLGDPQEEDAYSILSPEEGQDVIPLLFQTEVEESLNQLQTAVETQHPQLSELLAGLAEDLSGLGEMLQLPAFIQLCESVKQHLITAPDRFDDIAQAALQTWRRAQALVLTGNLGELPNRLSVTGITVAEIPASAESTSEFNLTDTSAFDLPDFDSSSDLPIFEPAAQAETYEAEAPGGQPQAQPQAQPQTEEFFTLQPAYARQMPETSLADAKNASDEVVAENTVRVPVKQLDRLNDLFGELTIERNGLDLNLKRLRTLMRTLTQRIQVLESSNTQLRDVYDKVATQRPNPLAAFSTERFSTERFSTERLADGFRRDGLRSEGAYSDGSKPDGVRSGFRPSSLSNQLDPNLLEQAPLEHSENAAPNLGGLPNSSGFDVLELDRYDDVHLLSQEVMETVVQIQEVASDLEFGLDEAEQTARELNKTARQLQTRITQVRMRPLSDVTERFPRALRELTLQYGKPVQLQVEGANTLIDRNILDALNEPLLHLVRNAFDHGIESSEIRQSWGKSPQGTITIRATHHQNRTYITIHDDGGGIPLDRIRHRARQMGLDEVLLAAASDEEILSLIFEPGFSTSEQVTALSGRGVGMDVVRERLKQVQGEITVDTEAGVGTTFTLSVPFTLSVMRVLLIESNGLLMAFPTNAIQEMIMLAPEQVIATAGSEAFTWNGSMVQLVRLKQWLTFNCVRSLESPEGTAAVRVPTVLLLPQGSQTVGLEVERCWGEQEVAIRKIQGGPDLPAGFSNCTILGDGRVVPLVSVSELLRWLVSCQRAQDQAMTPTAVKQSITALVSRPNRTVLIVDDSINVRRFLALTLEKAGYRVIQAKDGQDALDKLVDVTVQAVVCDIEMPRLDGYGFLARLKANPTYEQLPVAMLTTRSSDKHRQLALSLGATAYFSKPFNEQVLLQALEKMVAA